MNPCSMPEPLFRAATTRRVRSPGEAPGRAAGRILPVRLLAGCVLAALAGGAPALHGADCDGVEPIPGEAITLELVARAIDPVDVTAPPGDTERLFIVEQRGVIRIADVATGELRPAPFLNIMSKVVSGGELGLLGLAFHPDFAANGLFYVYYTRRRSGVCNASPVPGCPDKTAESVVARYTVPPGGDPDTADASSEVVLLEFCQPFGNHNGGQLKFGPSDGYLYISTGDGGSANDPCGSGQRTDTFLGKLLRIDVDGRDPGKQYAVPVSNPYAGTDGALPEIWAIGLRNPWRFSFDPETSDLYIGDVGQGTWEEIDYVPASSGGGENFEWKAREGDHAFRNVRFGPGERMAPILDYHHSSGTIFGRSVTGGVVYRGCRMPDLRGRYFFADYENRWVRSFRVVEGAGGGFETSDMIDHTRELGTSVSPSAFGVDGRGEIYICDYRGNRIMRLVPASVSNTPPTARIDTDPSPPVVVLENGTAEVTLDGRTSDDGDGGDQGLTYLWEKTAGPDGDSIATPSARVTRVTFTAAGEYTYRLTVNDSVETSSAEVTVTVEEPPSPRFSRGDSNADGALDISDGVRTLVFLFLEEIELPCLDAADADDSGTLEVTDSIYTFNFLFIGGPPPPEPRSCGPDGEDGDELDCAAFPPCP